MKIMVCLISDQHVPNLLTVHAVEPDLLFLIETSDMKRKNAASNFLNALVIGDLSDLQKEERHEIILLEDENSIASSMKIFQDVISKYPHAELFVNITGGTKPMSIAAFEFFKEKGNCTMLYVPINDQTKALKFTGIKHLNQVDEENAAARLKALLKANNAEPFFLDHKVSIGQFLAGYGFELVSSESETKDKENLAIKWFDASVILVANYNNLNVNEFLKHLTEISNKRKGRESGLNLQESDELYLKDKDLFECLVKIFPSIDIVDSTIKGCLDAHEVEFLTGGWLEVFIWVLLFNNSDILGIRDVHLNLEIGSKGPSDSRPKNEWDVTFMQGQSLCFIECKTGTQKKKKGEDILYKVEAIKKHLGALRVKSYLATTSPNIIDKATGKIYENLATRAALYNCKIIEGDKLHSLALMPIGQEQKSPKLIELIANTFNLGNEAQN